MPNLSVVFLANIPIFEGTTEQERGQLMQVMRRKSFETDQVIVQSEEKSRGLHIIVEGSASVVLDVYSLENPILDDEEGASRAIEHAKVAQLEIGSVFGEVSFFHNGKHTATVRANSAVELLTLPAEEYEQLLARESLAAYKLGTNAARILAERLRAADEMIGELVLAQRDPPTRLQWAEGHLQLHTGLFGHQSLFD